MKWLAINTPHLADTNWCSSYHRFDQFPGHSTAIKPRNEMNNLDINKFPKYPRTIGIPESTEMLTAGPAGPPALDPSSFAEVFISRPARGPKKNKTNAMSKLVVIIRMPLV